MVVKLLAYLHTGSATMLSETVHSLADMINQVSCMCVYVDAAVCVDGYMSQDPICYSTF